MARDTRLLYTASAAMTVFMVIGILLYMMRKTSPQGTALLTVTAPGLISAMRHVIESHGEFFESEVGFMHLSLAFAAALVTTEQGLEVLCAVLAVFFLLAVGIMIDQRRFSPGITISTASTCVFYTILAATAWNRS